MTPVTPHVGNFYGFRAGEPPHRIAARNGDSLTACHLSYHAATATKPSGRKCRECRRAAL